MTKEKLTEEEFSVLLAELAASKLVRVCGSFARGDYGSYSDIDFVVPRASQDQKAFQRLMAILDRHGVQYTSEVIGQVSTPRNLDHLPRPLEFMADYWISRTP